MSAKTTKKPVGVCKCGFGIAEHAMGDTICKNFKSNTGETVMTTKKRKKHRHRYEYCYSCMRGRKKIVQLNCEERSLCKCGAKKP